MLYSISDISTDSSYPDSRKGCGCYLFLEIYLLPLVKDLVALMIPMEQWKAPPVVMGFAELLVRHPRRNIPLVLHVEVQQNNHNYCFRHRR